MRITCLLSGTLLLATNAEAITPGGGGGGGGGNFVASLTSFTNNSTAYCVEIQNPTNSANGNKIQIAGQTFCSSGSWDGWISIGCAPFIVAPGQQMTLQNYFIPGQDSGQSIKIRVFKGYNAQLGGPEITIFYLQYRGGKICYRRNDPNFSTPCDGLANSAGRVTIDASGELQVTI
jgi:hypothetical protein